ncbi:alanyl-tRNA editing protein [Buttiauxella sp. 3AFRM03]|uniref:alanine--tRNA ligase-related protein n=1 Tax=Buttiauxella sp. 3AFRM03 TaxID=2479367 RepID=UPI000EF822BA|nr:alanyl-tRNA editing protein [Buttiauxella sp. 3AFRM03]AYN30382.1 alanyl-tRNA editing protein [Buttiauxella sp. 3AFRM03]
MNTTIRLFDEHPYESMFTAKVSKIGDDYIILDQTLFYPTSGNQECDSGSINNKPVNDVAMDCDHESPFSLETLIKHFIDVEGFQVGQQVECVVDFDRRLKTMRLHAASHLVEYFISQLNTFISVEGSFVSHEKDRTDYQLSEKLDQEALQELEKRVNDFVAEEHTITFGVSKGMRIWACKDITMFCCGTHVSNTREIGAIKLSRKNKGKGINRIEIHLL